MPPVLAHEQTAKPTGLVPGDDMTQNFESRSLAVCDSAEPSAADLFARGNYATLARSGPEEDWRTYASLGLIGKTEQAIEGLSRFSHEEAAFYAAVALWIGGQDDDNLPRLLEPLGLPHAQNLLKLVRKPRIEVLAQLPSVRAGCSDLLSGAASDHRFTVRNISFHPEDLPNRPYADIHHYYDGEHPPDFYACVMVEWHLIPPNLQELPCPILGQTGDYDLHIQAVYPWLNLFDELIVTDPSEWNDVTQLGKVPVSTFPKSFALPSQLPPLQHTPREVDVYLSGSVFHPYHLDKGELVGQLLTTPGLRVHLLNGFRGADEYYRCLSRAKLSITYVRHPQALPTRGLESLAMGCATVVQRGSVLTLFAGQAEGVLEYDLETGDLPQRVRQIVTHWADYQKRATTGARCIREQFSLARVASQYLRFLTFLAARPRDQRALRPTHKVQKRMVLEKGWLPSNDFIGCPLFKEIAIRNYEQLQSSYHSSPTSPHAYIDAARESVLANYHRLKAGKETSDEWLTTVQRLYTKAQDLFPQSLVTRFNHIRVLLHFGPPAVVARGIELLDETLEMPVEHWQTDVMEDVYPWDFFPHFFNYRHYFDLVTEHLTRNTDVSASLTRLILASLHSYRGFYPAFNGFYSRSLDEYRRALELDPAFPYYTLWYSEQLIERGLPEDYAQAWTLLTRLVKGCVPLLEVIRLLQRIHDLQAEKIQQLELRMATLMGQGAGEQASLLRGEINYLRRIWKLDDLRHVLPQSRIQLEQLEASIFPFQPPQKLLSTVNCPLAGGDSSSRISVLHAGLVEQLHLKQQEIEHLQMVIRTMESTKFWQARRVWFAFKRFLRLMDRKA